MSPAAHLVGSMNVPDARTAFELAARHAGDVVTRFPDGETGPRQNWIVANIGALSAAPDLELVRRPRGEHDDWLPDEGLIWFRVRPGVDAARLRLGPLSYADAAVASYEVFKELLDDGTLPADARLQVSLPTPWALTGSYIHPEDQLAVEPALKAALREQIDELTARLPHDRLAIQWDIAVEMTNLEGVFPVPFEPAFDETVARLAEITDWVATDVPAGLHLCYGDAGGEHIVQPTDLDLLVRVANAVVERASRRIDWIHMPVPIERDDDRYFQALDGLRIGDAELYLGLLHKEDGAEGARRRMEAARRHVAEFGVATECGMARDAEPSDIAPLLALHSEVADAGAARC